MFNLLLLKILMIFFFILSESGPDMFSKQPNPSSLYKPKYFLSNSLASRSKRCKPIGTQPHYEAPGDPRVEHAQTQ